MYLYFYIKKKIINQILELFSISKILSFKILFVKNLKLLFNNTIYLAFFLKYLFSLIINQN